MITEQGKRQKALFIDHIATNRPNCIIEAGTLETSFTDYYLVHIWKKINSRFCLSKKFSFVETKSLLRYDKELFSADLQAISWIDIFKAVKTAPVCMTEMFSSVFSFILDAHAPLTRATARLSKSYTRL